MSACPAGRHPPGISTGWPGREVGAIWAWSSCHSGRLSLQRRPGPIRRAFGAPAGRGDPKEPDGEDQQEGPGQTVLPAQPGSTGGQAPMSQPLLYTKTPRLGGTESGLME